jgi:hypothetical protein
VRVVLITVASKVKLVNEIVFYNFKIITSNVCIMSMTPNNFTAIPIGIFMEYKSEQEPTVSI